MTIGRKDVGEVDDAVTDVGAGVAYHLARRETEPRLHAVVDRDGVSSFRRGREEDVGE